MSQRQLLVSKEELNYLPLLRCSIEGKSFFIWQGIIYQWAQNWTAHVFFPERAFLDNDDALEFVKVHLDVLYKKLVALANAP